MGSWGVGNFENDSASDFIFDVIDSTTPQELLTEALQTAPARLWSTRLCCRGLAAAEVVAALAGHPGSTLPEECAAWVSAHKIDGWNDLPPLAARLVRSVLADSGLQRVIDVGDREAWRQVQQELLSRLESVRPSGVPATSA